MEVTEDIDESARQALVDDRKFVTKAQISIARPDNQEADDKFTDTPTTGLMRKYYRLSIENLPEILIKLLP